MFIHTHTPYSLHLLFSEEVAAEGDHAKQDLNQLLHHIYLPPQIILSLLSISIHSDVDTLVNLSIKPNIWALGGFCNVSCAATGQSLVWFINKTHMTNMMLHCEQGLHLGHTVGKDKFKKEGRLLLIFKALN